MRIVFMGTPDFAVETLEEIIGAGHEVVAVVTQPDKPQKRSKEPKMSPVKECALKHNLPVLQPEKVKNNAEFYEEMKNLKPDVSVVIAYGQILPKEILEVPKYGCINVHASLLPAYRGAAPIQWAVIDGLEVTGVTTMQMDVGLDTGDIIMQKEVVVDKKETGESLFNKISFEGAKLLVKTLEAVENNTATRTPQDNSKSNYAKMLSKETGKIDFNQSAVVIERLVRGVNPWPSAFTTLDGKTLKIWDCDVVSDDIDKTHLPGMICGITKDNFYVKCNEGVLKINELQLEGKKRMSCDAFLRGVKIEIGNKLGE